MAITPSEADAHSDRTLTRDPLIGTMLGEYRVLSRLGEGGMGVVYRGEQELLGKPVAIKVLKPGISGLLEEARAVTAAHHPNIIDIFSFGNAPTGQQYFVMECLEGESLDLYVRQQGKLSLDETITLLQQVAAGLSAAHAAGVIHRDLKPGNVFCARLKDGTRFVKVLDFGLAKRADPNVGVRGTSVVGTPMYMAPEQANRGELGPWTDLYALGCIAYELISGRPPFLGASLLETIALHVTHVPPRLSALDPAVPRELDDLVFELLEKTTVARPKNAGQVRKTLDRVSRQLSTARTRPTGIKAITGSGPVPDAAAPIAGTTEVAARPPRGRWIAAGVALVLAGAGASAWWFWPARAALVPAVAPPEPPPTASERPEEPPAPAPKPVPKPLVRPPRAGLTVADVEKRIDRDRDRARKLTDKPLGRTILQDLDGVWADLQKGASPEQIARELDGLEREWFP